MLTLRDINNLVPFEQLDTTCQNDLPRVFKFLGNEVVILYPDNGFLTYNRFINHLPPSHAIVSLDADMFFNAYAYLSHTDIIGVIDNHGKLVGTITNAMSAYMHPYQNDGGLDMWFLNHYDCIFLHKVNECSILLILEALQHWNGKRLVLVGEFWKEIAASLPAIDGVECFLEEKENIDKIRLEQYSNGYHCLHILEGIPHKEDPQRYRMGIVYYDEVMSFTYMFSKMDSYGEANPDLHFCVIDLPYENLGLMTLRNKALCVARYIKACGFIPVMHMAHYYKGAYQDYPEDDMWTKFFRQPENYDMNDVKNSKYVHHVPYFYNGNIQSDIMETRNPRIHLSFPDGWFNEKVTEILNQKIPLFLPHPDRTLGILARGTDFVKTKYVNHAIHANPEQICAKIDETLTQHPEYQYLYLSTEDKEYCQYFAERYKEKITFTDQKRYSVHEGESLMQMHEKENEKRDGFSLGIEYILSIECLGRCRGLIASGECSGLEEALRISNGNYLTTYIFRLGTNQEI